MKKFFPIISLFLLISACTYITAFIYKNWSMDFIMGVFMGVFFIIFGSFKAINIQKFATAYRKYDLLAMSWKPYASIYPAIELALGYAYITNVGGIYRDIFTLVIMTISLVGVTTKLLKKEKIQCACLGMVFVLPMTWVTFAEDALMIIMALSMIFI